MPAGRGFGPGISFPALVKFRRAPTRRAFLGGVFASSISAVWAPENLEAAEIDVLDRQLQRIRMGLERAGIPRRRFPPL